MNPMGMSGMTVLAPRCEVTWMALRTAYHWQPCCQWSAVLSTTPCILYTLGTMYVIPLMALYTDSSTNWQRASTVMPIRYEHPYASRSSMRGGPIRIGMLYRMVMQ